MRVRYEVMYANRGHDSRSAAIAVRNRLRVSNIHQTPNTFARWIVWPVPRTSAYPPAPVRVGQREPDCVQLQEDDEMGWVGGSTEEVLAAGRQPASHAMPSASQVDSVINFSLSSAPSASGAT